MTEAVYFYSAILIDENASIVYRSCGTFNAKTPELRIPKNRDPWMKDVYRHVEDVITKDRGVIAKNEVLVFVALNRVD